MNKNWSLSYLISRDRGVDLPKGFPQLSFDPRKPMAAAWFLDPSCYQWLSSRDHYFVKLTPEGRLLINGVPAGKYDLVLRLYEQPAGCLVETVGERVVSVEVTDADVAAGGKDLGTIEVECRAGPRMGENMEAYKFTDVSGRVRSIHEMHGQFVLLHVWASWCSPCVESLAAIKATEAAMGRAPITFVGLNVDKDVALAKEVAAKRGLTSATYLGESSAMARQLAISSVPTYFLIGDDGLLAASSNEWSEIKKKVEGVALH